MINLNNFFKPKSVVIVGVSRNPNKVGHVLFRNLLDGGYQGDVYIVNRSTARVLDFKCYKSVLKINKKIDLAIISVPAKFVLDIVKECNKKKIKDVLIITSGFAEVGDIKLENKLREFVNKNKMRMIGPNCLGILDPSNSLDTLFLLPHSRVHVNKSGVCNRGCTLEMGSVFGTDLVLKREGKNGMLAVEANKKYSIPVLTVEIGGGLKIWPSFIQEGVRGIKNLLSYYNMRKEDIILPKRQFVLNYRDNYKAPAEGILKLKVRLGDAVDKGCLLAEVHNPLEEGTRYIRSKSCGVIFAIKHQSKVLRHEPIVSMLNFDNCNIKKGNIKNAQLLLNKPKKGLIKLRKSLLFEKATKLKT